MNYLLKIKNLIIFLFVVSICAIVPGKIIGQSTNMEFRKFSKEQGLSNGFINGILQDKQGFLWIGTWNGLFRYDGYEFKNYKPLDNDPATISNGIGNFTEDNNDRFWIISPTGLSLFDKKVEKFKCIYSNDSLTGDYFTNIILDSKGILWLSTHTEGIWTLNINNSNIFNKTKLQFKKYEHKNNNPNSLSSNVVYGVFEDNQSNIWVNASNKIIDLYNKQTGNFEHFPINIPNLEKQSIEMNLRLEDSEGIYWLASTGAGLISWDRKHNVFKQFLNEPGKNSISSNLVTHIRQARDGILWISTDGGGVSMYNKKTGLFVFCKYEITNPNSLSSNAINSTFEDRSGVTWVATANSGLNKFELDKMNLGLHEPKPFDKNSLSYKSVTSIIQDKEGNFWIGTDGGGLNFWDIKTQKFRHFLNDPNNSNSISGNAVVCLAQDFEGNIWIGTYAKGLNCYNRKEDKFIRFTHDPGNQFSISHNNIWAILEDSKHNLWAASLEGTLNLFDRKTNRFYHYKNDPNDTTSFIERYTTNLFEDSREYLWIATASGIEMVKLNDYDFNQPFPKLKFNHYRHLKNKNSLSSSNVFCISEDHEGNMWFGTDGEGLNKLNLKTNEYNVFSVDYKFPDKSIKAILEDNDYNLWVSTANGISKFNPKTKTIHNYDFTDGLQDYYFSGAHCKSADGKLLFGGPNGFNIFDPKSLLSNITPPKVVLADIKVYGNSVIAGQEINGEIILTKSITETDTLTLSHKVNFFALEFTTLDFTNSERNKYAYKMVGFDNQWHNTDAKNRIATYTNLDAGRYTFIVKASNNNDVWNKKGVSLRIIILPPWWKTWWFRLIILICIIILLAYVLLRIIKRIEHIANQTILDEQNQLKTLINNIPHHIFIKDSKLKFIVVNRFVVDFLGGKTEKDIIQKTHYDFYPKAMADKLFAEEQEIIKTGIPIINREQCRKYNGKEIFLSTTKCPILNHKGETIGLVGISIDITEQKKIQLQIEKQSEELKNYNIVLSEANVLLEERQQQIEEQSEELKLTNEQLTENQVRIEEQAEELRAHSENLKDINDLLVDKQEIILQQSEQLKKTNQELSLLNVTKDRFFSIIAHDLRNPFNVVSGFSEILLKNFDKLSPAKIRKFHEMIHTSSTAGNNLLENLLQWSRSQTGRISYEPVKLNLLALAEETFRLLESDAERKNISIKQLIEPEITILADENMIKTIFRNLISNAIKFTGEEGTITLKSKIDNQMVIVSIADTGMGIPPETINKLFRVDTIITTKGTAKESGTGLGLLLCKEFVEKHCGKIWVESELGKRSEFKFTIPLA